MRSKMIFVNKLALKLVFIVIRLFKCFLPRINLEILYNLLNYLTTFC